MITADRQYIARTNPLTGCVKLLPVHPTQAFARLNHERKMWPYPQARIVVTQNELDRLVKDGARFGK